MIAFLVELENRVGSAAEVAEAIADRGINITAGAGLACGGGGQMALTTNDEAGTRRLLLSRGSRFREIELVPISLTDAPGTFARTCRALADAKINIEAVFAMAASGDRNTMAFATDDPARARSILGHKALTGSGR
jgi:hypothetical protein